MHVDFINSGSRAETYSLGVKCDPSYVALVLYDTVGTTLATVGVRLFCSEPPQNEEPAVYQPKAQYSKIAYLTPNAMA